MALLPEVPIDRSAGEAVEDDPAEEFGVRPLDLIGLLREVARKPDVQLNRAGLLR